MKLKTAILSVALLPALFGMTSQFGQDDAKHVENKKVSHHLERRTSHETRKTSHERTDIKKRQTLEELKKKGTRIVMVVTGYTAGPESTGKRPGDPGYGITKSGSRVKQGVTVVAGENIPFGTKIYIPYFDGKEGFGDGIFTVEDRGSAIGPYDIDVYFDELEHAINFGVKLLDVYILPKGVAEDGKVAYN